MTAQVPGLIDSTNVPRLISMLCVRGVATLHELQTVYGLEDAYDLLEMSTVDDYNRRAVQAWQQK